MSSGMKTENALHDKKMVMRAIKDAFLKLAPRTQIKNPVMFLVFVSAIMTTVLWAVSLFGIRDAAPGYILGITIILWFTVLFANFAEAIAEGRGKAQADSLRAAKQDVEAHKIPSPDKKDQIASVPSAKLVKGDIVIVKAGEQIPGDGEVIEGAASVDESAITGESAPVVREAGGDRSAVTGGTRVLSDWIVVRITSEPGQSFLDKMIAMVEGAARKKTPNEIALEIFSGCLVHYIYSCGYGSVRLFPFLCQTAGRGQSHIHNLSGGAAGLSGAHHYRRSAFCNRHRGNEPSESGKRTGYERPCH